MTSGPMKVSVSKEEDSNSENKTYGSLLPPTSYIHMCFPTHMHRSIHEIDFHFLKCTYFKTATLSVCTVKYKNTHRKTCTRNIESDIPFLLTHLNKRSQQNSHFYYDNIYLKTEAKNNNNKTAFCCSWGWNECSCCLSDQSNKPWILLWMDALVVINFSPETETGLWLPDLDLPVPVSLVSRGRFGFLSDGEQPAP